MLSIAPRDAARFWAKVTKSDDPDGCWLWNAGTFESGYGCFRLDGKLCKAHRVSLLWHLGALDDGMLACHSCDIRYPLGDLTYKRCVNPAHLWPGTCAQNHADRNAKGRQASGERHGMNTHPELRRVGDLNGMHAHPERAARGERAGLAKLTEDDVRAIRAAYAIGTTSLPKLARQYGVSHPCIHAIVLRHTWKHVT